METYLNGWQNADFLVLKTALDKIDRQKRKEKIKYYLCHPLKAIGDLFKWINPLKKKVEKDEWADVMELFNGPPRTTGFLTFEVVEDNEKWFRRSYNEKKELVDEVELQDRCKIAEANNDILHIPDDITDEELDKKLDLFMDVLKDKYLKEDK